MLDSRPAPQAPWTRGYLAAVGSAALLSTTAIFIRYLTETYQLPALVLAFWRDVFVVLTLIPILTRLRPALLRVPRAALPGLLVYGAVLAAFNATWTLSVAQNGAAVATVLVYCSVAFTALLGWLVFKEPLTWVKMVAILLSLVGCVLVSGLSSAASGSLQASGIAAGIGSGLCYATYSLLGRSSAQRGLNPWTTLLYTFGFAAGFLLPVNLLPGALLPGTGALLWLGPALAGWGILFLLAALPTVGGFGLYNVSLSILPSSVANLIVSLEPAMTAITAYLVLGERMTGQQLLGSGVILAAVLLVRIYGREATSLKTNGA